MGSRNSFKPLKPNRHNRIHGSRRLQALRDTRKSRRFKHLRPSCLPLTRQRSSPPRRPVRSPQPDHRMAVDWFQFFFGGSLGGEVGPDWGKTTPGAEKAEIESRHEKKNVGSFITMQGSAPGFRRAGRAAGPDRETGGGRPRILFFSPQNSRRKFFFFNFVDGNPPNEIPFSIFCRWKLPGGISISHSIPKDRNFVRFCTLRDSVGPPPQRRWNARLGIAAGALTETKIGVSLLCGGDAPPRIASH